MLCAERIKYVVGRSSVPCALIYLDELAGLDVDNYERFDMEGCTLIPLVIGKQLSPYC
jgi:hypothetical protein